MVIKNMCALYANEAAFRANQRQKVDVVEQSVIERKGDREGKGGR